MVSDTLKIIGLLFSLLILSFVIFKIRSRELTDEYAILWIFTSFLLFMGAIFSGEVIFFYQIIKGPEGGGPEILIFVIVIYMLFLLIILSSNLSVHQRQIKTLTQELSILENEIKNEKKNNK